MQNNSVEERALEEIAARVAHEVKNPLTMVGFNLDILEATDTRPLAHKNYAMIRKELRKINELMMDFIYLSGNYHEERSEVFIDSLLSEIEEDLSIAMPDVALHITYSHENIVICGYRNSIKTLFGNIVKNAVEAMGYVGELQIEVDSKDGYAKIAFKDSGSGLDERAREKMFKEQFSTKTTGSGLGLSICKKIAKEHGGDFELEDDVRGGCVAVVRLCER